MVDSERLAAMLANLERYVDALQELAAVPRDRFLGDRHLIASAKHHFAIAIQCCLDIANHAIASEGFRPPDDYADTFSVLVEQGVLPKDVEQTYRKMAQFRNRLVHLYWEVDDQLVYRFLRERLGDFDDFAKAVARLE